MTEKLRQQVVIPVWLIAVIIPAFITFTVFSTTQIRAQQSTSTKVELLELAMEKKADKVMVDEMAKDLREIRKGMDDIKNMLMTNNKK